MIKIIIIGFAFVLCFAVFIHLSFNKIRNIKTRMTDVFYTFNIKDVEILNVIWVAITTLIFSIFLTIYFTIHSINKIERSESDNIKGSIEQSIIPHIDKTEILMDAIGEYESGNDTTAKSLITTASGHLQILEILVRDANRINSSSSHPIIDDETGKPKQWTYSDRFSKKEAENMFLTVQRFYNPQLDLEKAIRMWNGGVGYTNAATETYYRNVRRIYERKMQEKMDSIVKIYVDSVVRECKSLQLTNN